MNPPKPATKETPEERHRRKTDQLFGQIALKLGLVTPAQLDEAIVLQRCAKEPRPLGALLQDLKIIGNDGLEKIIEAQKALAVAAEERARAIHDDNLFGKVAMRLKLCSEEQLKDSVHIQDKLPKDEFRRLGDIMISRGYLTSEGLQQILDAQRRLVLTCPKCATKYNTVMFKPGVSLPCYNCGTVLEIPALLPAPAAAAP